MRYGTRRRAATVDEGVIEGLRRMGASAQDIEAAQAQMEQARQDQADAEDFEVHADNWDAWMFFLSVQTQWVFASTELGAQRVGLHYPSVESAARMQRIPARQWPELFEAVQAVEMTVLAVDAKRRKASNKG